MRIFTSFIIGIVFLAGGTSNAQILAQLDARHGVLTVGSEAETNIVWNALQPGLSLQSSKTDWKNTGKGIQNVAGSGAQYWEFHGEDATNQWVKSMIFVLKVPENLTYRQTLVCGDLIARLSGAPFNKKEWNTEGRIEKDKKFCNITWSVNTVEGGVLIPGETCLFEVTFANAMRLSELGLFNDLGRKAWGRAWTGEIKSCFMWGTQPPSPNALAGIRKYLATEWNIPLRLPAITNEEIAIVRAEGVKFINARYGTIFLVR